MSIPVFNTDSTFKSLLTSFAHKFRLSMSPTRVSVAAGVKWMMVISAGAGDVAKLPNGLATRSPTALLRNFSVMIPSSGIL